MVFEVESAYIATLTCIAASLFEVRSMPEESPANVSRADANFLFGVGKASLATGHFSVLRLEKQG